LGRGRESEGKREMRGRRGMEVERKGLKELGKRT